MPRDGVAAPRERRCAVGVSAARGPCCAIDGRASGVAVERRRMTTRPEAEAPTVQRLGPPDLVELFGFLDRDPVLNVYLLALTLRDALARPQEEAWAARRGEDLAAVVHLGGPSGAVLPVGDDGPALDLLAEETLRRRAVMPRRIQVVGPRA